MKNTVVAVKTIRLVKLEIYGKSAIKDKLM
jgi:hypothetical protein